MNFAVNFLTAGVLAWTPLFLKSVVFAEILFASPMNEAWELDLVADLMKSES